MPIAVLAALVSACSTSTPSLPLAGSAAATVQSAGSMDAWHRLLGQHKLPGAGCFKANYPSAQWTRIACSVPPRLWYPAPASRRRATGNAVGSGRDFTANTAPNLISTSIGAFPKLKDVTSVRTVNGGVPGANSYTLQMNSDFFATTACGSIPQCEGWEQFVFENPPGTSEASLFIQDWLVAMGPGFNGCPPGQGWEYIRGLGCVENSPFSVSIPNVSVTDLGEVTETGVAAASGDSVYLSIGGTEYGMQNIQGDGITDLSANWTGSEFNIVGNAGGSTADFNSGAKVSVSIQVDDAITSKPECPANSGTTGEANNLFFVKAPAKPPKLQYPSIEFTMSTKTGVTPTCDKVEAI